MFCHHVGQGDIMNLLRQTFHLLDPKKKPRDPGVPRAPGQGPIIMPSTSPQPRALRIEGPTGHTKALDGIQGHRCVFSRERLPEGFCVRQRPRHNLPPRQPVLNVRLGQSHFLALFPSLSDKGPGLWLIGKGQIKSHHAGFFPLRPGCQRLHNRLGSVLTSFGGKRGQASPDLVAKHGFGGIPHVG